MTNASGKVDGAVSLARALLWMYTIVVCLVAGITTAVRYPATDDFGEPSFNFGGMLLAILVAAFLTLPFWALYIVGSRAVELVSKQRNEVGRLRAAVPGLAAEGVASLAHSEPAPAPTEPAPEASPSADAPQSSVLETLLADPTSREQASKTRRTYSAKVAAEFLTRKAAEAGHEGVSFTSADLPEDL